ncbi:MAG TPA: hypothetical protein VJM08_06850, partial [Anaerolineales bacterium]|nr:hypothetical protein [Anaerolineales bacterium]
AITNAKNDINDSVFTQMITRRIDSNQEAGDSVKCTSDEAHIVYLNLFTRDQGGDVVMSFNPAIDSIASTFEPVREHFTLEIPRNAQDETTFFVIDNNLDLNQVVGFVSMQTTEGADASCVAS